VDHKTVARDLKNIDTYTGSFIALNELPWPASTKVTPTSISWTWKTSARATSTASVISFGRKQVRGNYRWGTCSSSHSIRWASATHKL